MTKKSNNTITFILALSVLLAITSSAQAASAPDLGATSNFVILGGTSVTNAGVSTIFGDVGVSPGTTISGFTSTANTVTHAGDALAAQAQSDLTLAYNNVSAQAPTLNLTGELGGRTLTPGVYRFAATASLTNGVLTLDAQGNKDAVFIFQIGTTLTTSGNGGNGAVTLAGQTRSTNVFWQVGDSATLSSTSTFRGTIMALNSITMTTGPNGPAEIDGRVLARNGAVALNSNIVQVPQIIRLVNLAGARVANNSDKFPMSVAVIEPAGPLAGEGVILSSNRTQDAFVDVAPVNLVTTNTAGQAFFNITSILAGRAKITATTGKATVSNTDVVFVTAAPVLTTITVSPAAPSVVVGGTQQFTAATLDQFGNPFTAAVTWTSSNISVGTINAAGMFTATAAGTTTITAASGAVNGTATMTVTAPVPVLTAITVSPITATVVVGNTQQFTAATLDQFGSPIAATVTWNSSNASVGTINAAGMFTAVAAGTTTITAASGAISGTATATVTATAPVLTTITVSPATASVVVGNTTNFTAVTRDQVGNPIVAVVTWVSSNATVGTINPTTGVFTAVAAGTTTITAASGGVASAPATVTVTTAPAILTTITVSPATVSVVVGNTTNFTAATLDQFGNPIAAVVTWVTSNATVGAINPATGVFTALAAGTTNITAASGGIVSASATATVTTTLLVLTTITVSPLTAPVVVGNTTTFTAAPKDQNGAAITATVTWSSSNVTVGTINSTGVFTALAAGTTTITATSGIVNGTATANVTTTGVLKGDVNQDGVVNIVDALFIAQFTVGTRSLTAAQLAAADVNADGIVNIVDALFIAQFTVGTRTL